MPSSTAAVSDLEKDRRSADVGARTRTDSTAQNSQPVQKKMPIGISSCDQCRA